ncbi:MAG: hypothetical protein IJ301_03490 [Clostridia bacterium]|nr:hypothetical protein [Clostridia bacterium]
MEKDLISTPKIPRGGGALNSEKIAEKADKNGTFSDLKIEKKTLKKEQKRGKIIALILSIIFLFTVLVGGSVFLFVNHINKINASTTTTTTLANIYTTNGTLDKNAVIALLDAVGYWDNPSDTGTYTAHNIASRGTSGSDNTIIFPMGYYVDASGNMDTSKPILWQATYLWNNYLTVWMNTNYVVEYYNNSGTEKTGFGNGTSYSLYSNYSKSTLRDVTNNIYAKLNGKLESFSSIIQSPKNADATWQKTQPEDVHTYTSSNYDHHNGLYSYGGVYTGWANSNWNTSNPPYNDNFWIPSSVEVFNITPKTTSTTAQVNNGLWGLTAADRGFDTTTIEGSGTTSYCWLRSGLSGNNYIAMQVGSSGSANFNPVNGSYGVRPAAHISLSALKDAAKFNATTSVINSSMGTATGGIYHYNTTVTITATPNAGYLFDYWMIDGVRVEYNPYSFVITADVTALAYFKAGVLITANTSNSTYGTASGGGTFESGDLVSLTASPKTGYAFAYWQDSGGGTYESNPLTITASSAQTYTAYFIKYYTANITGSQTFTSDFSRDKNHTLTYYLTASSGYYFSTVTIDSITTTFEYVSGALMSANCLGIEYLLNSSGNELMLRINRIKADFAISLNFINTAPVLKEAGGLNIEGVAVQATNGGEVRLTGSDLTDDSDTVVCMAVAYAGYQFDGWTDSDGNDLGTDLSVRLTKEQVEGKIITANFVKIEANINTDTSNTDKLT